MKGTLIVPLGFDAQHQHGHREIHNVGFGQASEVLFRRDEPVSFEMFHCIKAKEMSQGLPGKSNLYSENLGGVRESSSHGLGED